MIDYFCQTGLNIVGVPTFGLIFSLRYSGSTAIGVAATALSILSAGRFPSLNEYANYTSDSKRILEPISCIKFIVNPNGKKIHYSNRNGIITEKIIEWIYDEARITAHCGEGFVAKHLVSRGAYALGAIGAVVTRTADLAIGIIATVISVIPFFGRNEKVNVFALKQLSSFGLIDDICISLRGIVNPHQFPRMDRAPTES